jgi:hypothetical protein
VAVRLGWNQADETIMTLVGRSLLCFILGCASVLMANGLVVARQVKQPPEVVEAYRVCESFEHLLGENLDFDRAYEATFPGDIKRRRAIAIAGGEFGDLDFTRINDELLIKAYKLRMQIFYFVLPLAGPDNAEEALFFPPNIKEILKREPPKNSQDFGAYVSQLDDDVAHFRSHLERLAAKYLSVSDRVGKFKSEARAAKFEPPRDYKVQPSYGYIRAEVLNKKEAYYTVNGYTVAREHGKMRIVEIRFFNRLF